MALKAVFPSMTTSKDMKFYPPSSVSSEDDQLPEENFHLHLSDEEDNQNSDEKTSTTNKPQSSEEGKESEEDILNKFEIEDHDPAENMITELEENLLEDGEEDGQTKSNTSKLSESKEENKTEHDEPCSVDNMVVNDSFDESRVEDISESNKELSIDVEDPNEEESSQNEQVSEDHDEAKKENDEIKDECAEKEIRENNLIEDKEVASEAVEKLYGSGDKDDNALGANENEEVEVLSEKMEESDERTEKRDLLEARDLEESKDSKDSEESKNSKDSEESNSEDISEKPHSADSPKADLETKVGENEESKDIYSKSLTNDDSELSEKNDDKPLEKDVSSKPLEKDDDSKSLANDSEDADDTTATSTCDEESTIKGNKDDLVVTSAISEGEKHEILKLQTMDTEDLLEIVDVKPADENSLLQDMKEVSSSSENSEKDETEDSEELEADKLESMEYEDAEVLGEDKAEDDEAEADNEPDDAMDSIDIEENTLIRDETFCDMNKSVDSSACSEKEGELVEKEGEKVNEASVEEECLDRSQISPDEVPKSGLDDGLESEAKCNQGVEGSIADPSSPPLKAGKRSIHIDSEVETASKRIKLVDDEELEPLIVQKEGKISREVESLNCLVEFMKSSVLTKLSRNNLEQLCLQKMCEAVVDKSEIGELRHQLKVQEQMVEHWRKEVLQLTKQARDLETVNNRLMSDFRQRHERDKPIMPLKITRSVGLQVNPENFLSSNRRKTIRVNQTQSAPSNSNVTANKPVNTNTTVSSPTKKQAKPVQTSATPNGPATLDSGPTDTATNAETKKADSGGSSFIDLTDEDDKKANEKQTNNGAKPIAQSPKSTAASPAKTNPATPTTKNYRIVSPSGVNVTTTTPRLMYVVNSPVQSIITTTPSTGQKSLLKVNANGVIGQPTSIRPVIQNGNMITQVNAVRSPSIRPVQTVRPTPTSKVQNSKPTATRHPAPLPATPVAQVSIASRKPVPPKPHLQIRKNGNAIVLSWKMPYNLNNYETIASYQLYAYQETNAPPSTDMWRKVGDIKALALPMACTLTQFADGNKYHFAVRAVDVLKRVGPFSDPGPILL